MIIGIGTQKGVTEKEVINGIETALFENNINIKDIEKIASAKMKENETELINAANTLGIELIFVPHCVLNKMDAPTPSKAEKFGLKGVAEPASLAVSATHELIMRKKYMGESQLQSQNKGKLYIIGIGPGSVNHISIMQKKYLKNQNIFLDMVLI